MPVEKISADEAHELRKDVVNSKGVMAKGVPITPEVVKAPKIDETKREARFVMSAEVTDRMGDVVVQEGLDLTNFKANPQALLFHDSRNWPIGSWKDVEQNLTGRPRRTEGTMKLLPEGTEPDADRAFRHIKAGTMRTVSIGFRPKWDAAELIRDDDGRMTGLRFNEGELLECSLVPIPALPAAAMKEMTTGMMSPETIELIKGIVENYGVDAAGTVQRREDLEGVLREAGGNKSYHLLDGLKVGESLVKTAEGSIELRSATPTPAPAQEGGESVPIAPNPADTEKQKSDAAAQAESIAMFERHTALVKEAARTSSEPGIFARLLSAFHAKDVEAPAPQVDPVVETKADAPVMSAEDKAALRSRVEKSIESAAKKAVEPDPV